jgi:hypothetical protein
MYLNEDLMKVDLFNAHQVFILEALKLMAAGKWI